MAAEGQNFEMYQGDSKELQITVTDDDGNLVNLSGATITWKLYKSYSAPALVLKTSDPGGGIRIDSPENGLFSVVLTEADTNGFFGQYNHEARVGDIRGLNTIVTTGKVMIHQRHTLGG